MNTDAIVNTANEAPVVGPGCDFAVYQAAGLLVIGLRQLFEGDFARSAVPHMSGNGGGF